MCYDGRGTLRNFIEAARWYRLAADQGQPVAETNLALLYGMGIGVPQDTAAMAQLLGWSYERLVCAIVDAALARLFGGAAC